MRFTFNYVRKKNRGRRRQARDQYFAGFISWQRSALKHGLGSSSGHAGWDVFFLPEAGMSFGNVPADAFGACLVCVWLALSVCALVPVLLPKMSLGGGSEKNVYWRCLCNYFENVLGEFIQDSVCVGRSLAVSLGARTWTRAPATRLQMSSSKVATCQSKHSARSALPQPKLEAATAFQLTFRRHSTQSALSQLRLGSYSCSAQSSAQGRV